MGVEVDENALTEEAQMMTDAVDAMELDADYFDPQMVSDDSNLKDIHDNQKTLCIEATWFNEREEWMKVLKNIKEFRVLKMPQILLSLFFLCKFERDEVCEPKTNKLSWKKAKNLIENDLPVRMKAYKLWGEKKEEYLPYQRINFTSNVLQTYSQEEVDAYHKGVGKLFKWLKMAINSRKNDIIRRKAIQKKNREEKTSREEAKAKRAADREQFLEDKETEFNDANREDIEAYNKWKEEEELKAA